MNRVTASFLTILVVLSGVALYLAIGAAHRGEGMAAFVMVVIAMIFWKRATRRS